MFQHFLFKDGWAFIPPWQFTSQGYFCPHMSFASLRLFSFWCICVSIMIWLVIVRFVVHFPPLTSVHFKPNTSFQLRPQWRPQCLPYHWSEQALILVWEYSCYHTWTDTGIRMPPIPLQIHAISGTLHDYMSFSRIYWIVPIFGCSLKYFIPSFVSKFC